MSSSAVIYPSSFLERPEDRSVLIELSFANVPKDTARLILYRIWADFGTGGSDRRLIVEEDIAADRQVRVLEGFCEWTGEPGALVRMAVGAGFLSIDRTGERPMLVCCGFYPLNSAFNAKGRSFQRLGGLTRGLKARTLQAEQDASAMERVWERTGNPFPDVPPDELGRATRFIFQVCRALRIDIPGSDQLQAGVMRMAIECVRSTGEDKIKETLLWLLSRRGASEIPDRLDAVLRAWPSHVAAAAGEMENG